MPDARSNLLGPRGLTLALIAAAGAAAAYQLELSPADLEPNRGGLQLVREFLSAGLRPALTHEAPALPPGTKPFLLEVLQATGRTLLFAAAAMSLAILIGLTLGVVAADSWWRPDARGGQGRPALARSLQVAVRTGIALLRSVHELLWAVLFLAALGLNTFAAVIALAIPYGGTLAKVFSEMLDEAAPSSAEALRGLGARPVIAFGFGRFPRALPDLVAYTFYRFECCVRSSAILGFFGYETLGYHISLSFGDTHYREVWSYVYALLALVLLMELWSATVRRRLTT